MKRWLAILLLLSGGAAALAAPLNILLIVSDDQRPDTIRALGNPHIHTPHLDRLVARGTSFSRAIAAYPICHVSRAEILTGCTAFRAYPNYPSPPIDPRLATFAGTFQKAGHTTCYTGKWHNDGQPTQRGYSTTSGLFSSGGGKGRSLTHERDSQGRPVTGYSGWTLKGDDGTAQLDKGIGLTPRTSEHIAAGAIAFLNRQAKKEAAPFFLHVNFAAPHDPRLMPSGYEGRYDPATLPLPANFARQHPFDHGNADGRDERLLPKPLDEADCRRELACYYAVITHMDEQIGRILAALEAAGRATDTLVIFTTDQGLAMGGHGLMGKQNMYEHTVGVPLLMAGPGIPAGKIQPAQCHLRDLFPTCCELAGIPIPATVQGRSLAPVLAGRAERVHDFVTAYFTDSQRMIRDPRWKLARYPQAGQVQLFDLETDPLELTNLAADPAHRPTRDRLDQALTTWLRESGDPVTR